MPALDSPPIDRQSFFASLSWAVYLACSWTWCIGMFLPVLLVRDYGPAGWIRFAIPNIIGAAAMGWILRRPGLSERIVLQHRFICIAFSAITLAFHAFFLSWLANRIIPIRWCVLAIAVGSLAACTFPGKKKFELCLAWLVLAISLAVLIHGTAHIQIPQGPILENHHDLNWLTSVCIFGFLLCPYLDLTFHRARQSISADAAKIAFGIGFGIFFLSMILLTLLYAGDVIGVDDRLRSQGGSFGLGGLRTWVALHIAVQTGFTWTAHLRALPKIKKSDIPIWIVAPLLALATGSLVWIHGLEVYKSPYTEMYTGEVIYRVFMAFYGLVFPAYVWVCILPLGRPAPGPTPHALTAWITAVLIATPMFWMAFIEGKMGWLGPGLGVVLISRLAAGLVKTPHHSPDPSFPETIGRI